jgi:cyclic dehypoxanthinyl futalosine synthase
MGISREQALDCFRSDDLVGIGMEADAVRRRLHPEGAVSYAVGRRIDCAAVMQVGTQAANKSAVGCAHRLFDEIGEMVEMGGTGVRLVYGVEHDMAGGITWFEGLFRGIKQRYPTVWIESLSAVELRSIAAGLGVGFRETIARLMDAGLDSIAGGGVGLGDGAVPGWSEVHRAAHGLGMRTTVEMVFGAGETSEQRIESLEEVRRLQEETGGFVAFAPVMAEAPGGRELDSMTAVERLKTLSIARMFLDNIENVQASVSAQGLKVLQMGLRFGANDVGLVETKGSNEEDVRRIIRDAGFRPVQRDIAHRALLLT